MHFALRGDAQAVAAGAEVFAVWGDDADVADVVGVAVFASGAGVGLARLQLPALLNQVLFQLQGVLVVLLEVGAVVACLHQFYKAQGDGAAADVIQRVVQGFLGVFAQQQGVDFDAGETCVEYVFNAAQDGLALVFACDFFKGFGVEAV